MIMIPRYATSVWKEMSRLSQLRLSLIKSDIFRICNNSKRKIIQAHSFIFYSRTFCDSGSEDISEKNSNIHGNKNEKTKAI